MMVRKALDALALPGLLASAHWPCGRGEIGRRAGLKKWFVYHIHRFCDGPKV